MFVARDELSAATTALVLVIPVVGGVSVGGFLAGLVATATCFVVWDYLFLPPYYTLSVARAQDWVALGVYVVVMVTVARVVATANEARAASERRAGELRRLFDLSELLVRELPVDELLGSVTSGFDLDGAALLLPAQGRLAVVSSAGVPLSSDDIARLSAAAGPPVHLGPTPPAEPGNFSAVALVAMGQPIGLLAVRAAQGSKPSLELLQAFANHLALALERAGLRDEAVRARLLEEVDALRRALVGAVSHDLRAPLATIKVSASTLVESGAVLSPGDVRELAELVDTQADRLDRLVSNLLDMTRIQSGALELRRRAVAVGDLVEEALAVLGRSACDGEVSVDVADELPAVDVDAVLVRQVLANLLDNAVRFSPPGSAVAVSAVLGPGGKIQVRVTDSGPGVAPEDRERIFQMFNRSEAGGRGGLGLAIALAFVGAHGERIWVEDAGGGPGSQGASFVFTLPAAQGHPGPAGS